MTTQRQELIPEWTQGDRLRKARELLEMDQRDFADHIGVSRQSITNAEKGHVKVRQITLKAWALATGVPIQWLENGTLDHTPTPLPLLFPIQERFLPESVDRCTYTA